MAKSTFAGGVHLTNKKHLTMDKSIRVLKAGNEVVYPLVQHYGEAAVPTVSVGDRVVRGQMIAECGGEISAPIHASVSGTISAVEERNLITGKKVMSIVIENDGQMESIDFAPKASLSELSNEDILDIIMQAGVVDTGSVGMPLHFKLKPSNPEKVDYVIVKGVQSETYGTAELCILKEQPERVIKALRIILRLFENARGVLAMDESNPQLIRSLGKYVKDDARVSIKKVDSKYPQNADQQLIYAITERKLSKKKMATEHKCLILNVETLLAVYAAVMEGKPYMDRILTLSGKGSKNPGNYQVPIGVSYRDLIKQSGGFAEKAVMICGDTMTGLRTNNFKAPVTKISAGITGLETEENMPLCEGDCIRCGRCVEVCPARLIPQKLYEAARDKDKQAFALYAGNECTECGCCSYICPANLPLTQSISSMHKGIAQKKKSPHIHSGSSGLGIMFATILAILPVLGSGVAKYGVGAIMTVLVAVLTALVAEICYDLYQKKFMVFDMTTLALGFLFGLSLPAAMPVWLTIIGSFLMVVVYRILNHYLGRYVLNPAVLSTLLLSVVALFVMHGQHYVIAEASLITPLIGACILILAGVTDLRIPGCFLGAFSLMLLLFGGAGVDFTYLTTQLTLSAAVFYGFFLLPQYQSRPITINGQYVYGIIAGILAAALWLFKLGNIAVPASIVVVNLLVPVIESNTLPLPFGQKTKDMPEKTIIKKKEM